MTEAQLTLKARKAADAEFGEDIYIKKNHGGRYSSGQPDLDGCLEGRYFGIEMKLPGKERTLTKLQAANLEHIRLSGGRATVATSVKEVLKFLRKVQNA